MKEQTQETRNTGTITISRAEYDALMEAKSQNEWLMEQLRLLKKKQFGASSEQTKEPLDGQMSLLFNEAEAYTAPPGPQKTTQVAAQITSRWRWWSTVFPRRSRCARSAENGCARSGQRYGRH